MPIPSQTTSTNGVTKEFDRLNDSSEAQLLAPDTVEHNETPPFHCSLDGLIQGSTIERHRFKIQLEDVWFYISDLICVLSPVGFANGSSSTRSNISPLESRQTARSERFPNHQLKENCSRYWKPPTYASNFKRANSERRAPRSRENPNYPSSARKSRSICCGSVSR